MNFTSNKNAYLPIISIIKRNCSSLAGDQSLSILLGLIAAITLINGQSFAAVSNVLRVGPGQTYSRVQDATAAAQDGDTIEISAGTYSGDAAVATLSANNLTVRGVGGGRAHLEANGAYVQGKGIWVTTGNNLIIENIEFSGAAVPDANGAGIRVEGAGLTIRNCYFHNNENGILTNQNVDSDLVVEYSEFNNNGNGVGNTHNMYIGHLRSFTLRGSWTHRAYIGHNIKSRALKNLILYNRISDEADGQASYDVNLPEGGDCFLIGNVIEKGPSSANHTAFLTYGEDGNNNPVQQLTLVNNTLVDDRGVNYFVYFFNNPPSATFTNNIFAGSAAPISNFAGAVARNNLTNQDPQFVNRAGYDYHLMANSPAINAGTAPGTVNGVDLNPSQQYVYPTSTEARSISGSAIDIGAFERQSVNAATGKLFDFDGDGKSDISVFRPSTAIWYLQRSQLGFTATQFGIATDKLAPADYDGDGKTDIAVFRDGTWYVFGSQIGFTAFQFGQAGDIPVPADYDGDGRADYAVFRNGVWYIQRSTQGSLTLQFGAPTDKPVPADYDGDGKTDIAVFRDGTWYLLRSQLGFTAVQYGVSGDKTVVGDYDGDGKADVAVFRNGVWYLNRSSSGFLTQQFGLATDVPVAADYDGDGKTDIAVFRNGSWYISNSSQGFTFMQFGTNGDQPIPAAFVR